MLSKESEFSIKVSYRLSCLTQTIDCSNDLKDNQEQRFPDQSLSYFLLYLLDLGEYDLKKDIMEHLDFWWQPFFIFTIIIYFLVFLFYFLFNFYWKIAILIEHFCFILIWLFSRVFQFNKQRKVAVLIDTN